MLDLDSAIRDQAYEFFMQEAQEFLAVLEAGILDLRHERDVPKIHNLMRAAHSIKGGAAGIGLQSIQAIAHRLENIFRALYQEEISIDLPLEELLLQAYDCLRTPIMQQVQLHHHDAEDALQSAQPIFKKLEDFLGDALQANYELPSAADLGIDIVHEVFTGDVSNALARLDRVLSHPDTEEVSGEIRAQAEVFFGVGELVNLPGFMEIARLTLAALNHHPDAVLQIGKVALSDFRAAQAAVLNGDRTQGGHPCNTLFELASGEPVAEIELVAMPEQTAIPALITPALEEIFGDRPDLAATTIQDEEREERTDSDPEFCFTDHSTDVEPGFVSAVDDIDIESPSEDWLFATEDLSDAAFRDLEAELQAYSLEDLSVELEDLDTLFAETSSLIHSIDQDEDELSETDLATLMNEFAGNPSAALPPMHEYADEPIPSDQPEPPLNLANYIAAPLPVSQESSKSSKPIQASPYLSSTIKVDLSRLERINNLVGELVTQESSSVLQSQQIQGVIHSLSRRLVHFEQLTKELQEWADHSQRDYAKLYEVNTTSQIGEQLRSSPIQAGATEYDLVSFDPLQMDSYNRFSLLIQDIIEEVAQLSEAARDTTLLAKQTQHLQRQKHRTLKQVRNQLLRARMFPVGDILQRFPRMLRDLSAQYNKQVSVKLNGTATLVDKVVLEKLFDPLVHLVRNAFDHGIEMPDDRTAQGKPAQATIEVRAYHRGNQTYIEVRDDGKGIDIERVRAKAIALNLITPDAAVVLPKEKLYEFLFAPGFSTAAQVSELSGRGVGLDAVMAQIKSLKGSITLTSEPGKGTTFLLRFPLTLTIADLLIFGVDEQILAVPVDSLIAIATASADQFHEENGQQIYQWQEECIPVYPRSALLRHYPLVRPMAESRATIPLPQDGTQPLLLIAGETGILALPVDQIMQQQELMIKPFGGILSPPPYLYGCTILGDGTLVPVIDGQALVAEARDRRSDDERDAEADAQRAQRFAKLLQESLSQTLLVVDDSLTARQALAATLKKAGYQVIQAQDGREALKQLQRHPMIRAVFCDVEMPRMNGFEFLNHCRRDLAESAPPVIMLTSRGGKKHRQIAQALGAKGYLTKPYHEPVLLATLQEVMA